MAEDGLLHFRWFMRQGQPFGLGNRCRRSPQKNQRGPAGFGKGHGGLSRHASGAAGNDHHVLMVQRSGSFGTGSGFEVQPVTGIGGQVRTEADFNSAIGIFGTQGSADCCCQAVKVPPVG